MARINYRSWGHYYEITFGIHEYTSNGNLAIQMLDWSDGYAEPFSMLTVNLDKKCEPNCAYIDINNNSEYVVDWLINNNFGNVTGKLGFSGFCVYPEFRFNMDELKKYVEG